MTRDDNVSEALAATELRVRAALAAEAGSVTETDLRRRPSRESTSYRHRRRRQKMLMLVAASTVIVLGGVVTILSVAGGRSDRVAESGTPSPGATVTLSALPGNSMSCAYEGFSQYAQDAVRQGGAMVTGILRPTGASPHGGTEQAPAVPYLPVQITVTAVLAGQLPAGEIRGSVEGGGQTTAQNLDFEGNTGWASDGAFLGVLFPRTDGTFFVNPTPLADGRAVVGLGCWSAGGLPSTRERIDLVLAGQPSVTISAPVDLVTVQDIRGSLG